MGQIPQKLVSIISCVVSQAGYVGRRSALAGNRASHEGSVDETDSVDTALDRERGRKYTVYTAQSGR